MRIEVIPQQDSKQATRSKETIGSANLPKMAWRPKRKNQSKVFYEYELTLEMRAKTPAPEYVPRAKTPAVEVAPSKIIVAEHATVAFKPSPPKVEAAVKLQAVPKPAAPKAKPPLVIKEFGPPKAKTPAFEAPQPLKPKTPAVEVFHQPLKPKTPAAEVTQTLKPKTPALEVTQSVKPKTPVVEISQSIKPKTPAVVEASLPPASSRPSVRSPAQVINIKEKKEALSKPVSRKELNTPEGTQFFKSGVQEEDQIRDDSGRGEEELFESEQQAVQVLQSNRSKQELKRGQTAPSAISSATSSAADLRHSMVSSQPSLFKKILQKSVQSISKIPRSSQKSSQTNISGSKGTGMNDEDERVVGEELF